MCFRKPDKSPTPPPPPNPPPQEQQNKTKYPEDDEVLDCGKPVNFTYYDNLVGIANRLSHPNVPEPQVRMLYF